MEPDKVHIGDYVLISEAYWQVCDMKVLTGGRKLLIFQGHAPLAMRAALEIYRQR
ncbi:hypothetical protein [Streptomyces griseus]|uniref:hypothetical protein n=1 Tax=Streptomyces griseus TaxID=1911 RepID=UPI00379BB719